MKSMKMNLKDLYELAEQEHIKIIRAPLSDSLNGLYLNVENHSCIVLNSLLNKQEKRLTLAHELRASFYGCYS